MGSAGERACWRGLHSQHFPRSGETLDTEWLATVGGRSCRASVGKPRSGGTKWARQGKIHLQVHHGGRDRVSLPDAMSVSRRAGGFRSICSQYCAKTSVSAPWACEGPHASLFVGVWPSAHLVLQLNDSQHDAKTNNGKRLMALKRMPHRTLDAHLHNQ